MTPKPFCALTLPAGDARRSREDAVHTSHSYTAQEALDKHLIDLTGLERLGVAQGSRWPRDHPHGRQQARASPDRRAHRNTEAHHARRAAGLAGRSQLALLFLIGGALLIYLEFNTPGTIVPERWAL